MGRGFVVGNIVRGGEAARWKNEKESWEMAMVGRKMKADAKSKGYR